MTRPTEVIEWANGTPSGDVGPALTVASIAYFSLGEVDLLFSGTPDLSAINPGHMLTVQDATFDVNNGSFVITQVDPAGYRLRVRNMTRYSTTTAEDEPTSLATAQAQNGGPALADIPAEKQEAGYFDNEYPSAAHFNRLFQNVTRWTKHLSTILPVGYELLQARLTAGPNITLTNNGDGTVLITGAAAVTSVPVVSETFTQASHGFAVKDAVRHNGTTWVKAQANSIAGCISVWVVTAVASGSVFTASLRGRVTVTGHGLTPGTLYYLSADTAGLLMATMPVGSLTRPLGYYLRAVFVESANVLHILGDSAPTFNPVYAQNIATGSGLMNFTFTNLSLNNVGGRATVEGIAEATTSSGRIHLGLNGGSTVRVCDGGSASSGHDLVFKARLLQSVPDSAWIVISEAFSQNVTAQNLGYRITGVTDVTSLTLTKDTYDITFRTGHFARILIDQMPAT